MAVRTFPPSKNNNFFAQVLERLMKENGEPVIRITVRDGHFCGRCGESISGTHQVTGRLVEIEDYSQNMNMPPPEQVLIAKLKDWDTDIHRCAVYDDKLHVSISAITSLVYEPPDGGATYIAGQIDHSGL